jgi:hypothetical protein
MLSKTFDVSYYSPRKSFASFSDMSKSGVAPTSRSKPVRVVRKNRFIYNLKDGTYSFLYNSNIERWSP